VPDPSDKPGGFTVTDRRTVSADGGARAEAPGSPASVPAPPSPAGDPAAPADASGPAPAHGEMPPLDFGTFVLSLGSSALLHFGEAPAGDDASPARDLALAKHTIDLLAMLEDKTRGNLAPAEKELLESLLYDLRLRYVGAARAR